MKVKQCILLIIILNLMSCGSPTNVKPQLSNQQLAAQYLSKNQFQLAKNILPSVRNTENSKNLVKLYMSMHEKGEPALNQEVDYMSQFYNQMNFIHQSMFNQIKSWLYLKQIYRQEIQPPVRILQREILYLAPSNIDFDKCHSEKTYCANEARKELIKLRTKEEITKSLKSMALRDPCVNLAATLKGETEANRCLRASKGDLQITLLPKPHFSTNEWLQALTHE